MQELKTPEDFDNTINKIGETDELLIIDFYAPWCVPCKNLMATIEKIEQDIPGYIFKVDIDSIPEKCTELGIRTIPTVLAFRKGVVVGRKSGQGTEQDILDWVKTLG